MGSPKVSIEGQGCCFWTKHSDCVSQTTYTGCLIVAALSAIAIVAGVFLLLGQKGYPVGPFKAWSYYVPTSYIYASELLTITTFLLSSLYLFTLARKLKQQVFSEEELKQWGVLTEIKETLTLTTDIPEKHYSIYISPGHATTPQVYAIYKKTNAHSGSLVPFKDEESAIYYLSQLKRFGYVQADEAMWTDRDQYQLDEVKSKIQTGLLDRKCTLLAASLPQGFFNWDTIYIKDWSINCLLVATRIEDQVEFVIWRESKTKPEEIGKHKFPELLPLPEVQKAALAAKDAEVGSITEVGTHHHFSFVFREDIPILAVTYLSHSMEQRTEIFLEDKQRDARLKDLGFLEK